MRQIDTQSYTAITTQQFVHKLHKMDMNEWMNKCEKSHLHVLWLYKETDTVFLGNCLEVSCRMVWKWPSTFTKSLLGEKSEIPQIKSIDFSVVIVNTVKAAQQIDTVISYIYNVDGISDWKHLKKGRKTEWKSWPY